MSRRDAFAATLWAAAPIPVYARRCEPDLGFTFIADSIADVLGHPAQALMDDPHLWRRLLHPEDRGRVLHALQSAQPDARVVLEYRMTHADGSPRWVRDDLRRLPDQPLIVGALTDITESKATEAALREEKIRLQATVEGTHVGTWAWNVQTGETHFNSRWAEIVGYTLEELAPVSIETWARLAHPDDLAASNSALERHFSGEAPFYDIECRMRHKDGRWIWVHDRGRVFTWSPSGKPLMMYGTHTDITERREAEARLRALAESSEAKRTAALEALSVGSGPRERSYFTSMASKLAEICDAEIGLIGILRADPAPRIRTLALVVEGEPQEPIEYDPREAPCDDVAHGRPVVLAQDVLRTFPRHPQIQALRPEGYVACPLYDSHGAVLGMVAVMTRQPMEHPERVASLVRLFAVRLAVEVERRRAEDRFTSVFDYAPDALLIVNGGGEVVLANRTTKNVLGYGTEDLIGRRVEELVPTEARGRHEALRASFFAHPAPHRMGSGRALLNAVHRDGQVIPVEITLSPLRFDDDLMVVAAIRDVSQRVKIEAERSRLEEHVRQAEKMEALGRLARGIAHDFNNLLTSIVGNLGLAQDDVAPDSPLVEHLAAIDMAAGRAAELVRQIHAFGHNAPATMEPQHVSRVLHEVARLLRPNLPTGIDLRVEAMDEEPMVLMNVSQMHRVMMNLGTNAWHAIGDRPGRILLAVRETLLPTELTLGARLAPGPYVQVQVTDNGQGMDAATMDQIFEPFFTTKPAGEGSGLGLSVVHGVVAEHGGTITVESTLGVGTTFSILLPVANKEPEKSTSAPRGRIAVVDDEPALTTLAAQILTRRGYLATPFVNANDLVAALEASPKLFDVVLANQNMPHMSGLGLGHTLHVLCPHVPMILMSGARYPDSELAAAHIRAFIAKPFTPEQLEEVVEQVLRTAQRPSTDHDPGAVRP
ncbi:MAG: PAS domain S-box protein [Deltaproteobacteria bacterium]|nr:PAS domain S-box protein [Deltaproteobacteria bacterium]